MDYLDRVKAITIEEKSFTDKETGEVIEYKRLSLAVDFGGEAETLEFKVDAKDAKLLKAADVQN